MASFVHLLGKREERQNWTGRVATHSCFVAFVDSGTVGHYGQFLDKLYEKTGMDPLTKQHVESVETTLQQKLIGVGIWGDGAPCNWDRSDSIEVCSMLLPGLSEEWRNLRIPLTGLSKKHVITPSTFHDICEVFAVCQCALSTW